MRLRTQFERTGNELKISFDGRIDFESQVQLKKDLNRILEKIRSEEKASSGNKSDSVAKLVSSADSKLSPLREMQEQLKGVVFDFAKLEFVGSSSLAAFFQTIRDFQANAETDSKTKIQLSSLSREFKQILKTYDPDGFLQAADIDRSKRDGYNA